jgi:hypothetical protein
MGLDSCSEQDEDMASIQQTLDQHATRFRAGCEGRVGVVRPKGNNGIIDSAKRSVCDSLESALQLIIPGPFGY